MSSALPLDGLESSFMNKHTWAYSLQPSFAEVLVPAGVLSLEVVLQRVVLEIRSVFVLPFVDTIEV